MVLHDLPAVIKAFCEFDPFPVVGRLNLEPWLFGKLWLKHVESKQ